MTETTASGVPAWHSRTALGALAAICALSLWFPSDADEAFFTLGAQRLNAGAVYYRDLWDIKQPGIYWFYQLGDLLGLGGLGVRVLELALVMVCGLLVWRTTRTWGLHPLARIAGPGLVLGTYVLLSHRSGVGQIEGLSNLLVVMMVSASWPSRPGRRGVARPAWRWLLAGLAAGGLGLLKQIYLPLAAVLLLGALLDTRVRTGARARLALAAIGGAAVPLLLTAGYLLWNDTLRRAWLTAFQIPALTLGATVMGDDRTRHLELVIGLAGLVIPLAAVGLLGARRRGTVVREATMALAAALGLVLAVPQYPTPYRLLVLVAPLGFVAVSGLSSVFAWVDALADRRAAAGGSRCRPVRYRVAALTVMAVLLLPMLRGPQRLLFAIGEVPSWGLGEDARLNRDLVLTSQQGLQQDARLVAGVVTPGEPIYVIGDPRLYQLLRARQAIEISGWAVSLMPEPVWHERDRELVRSQPAVIYVESSQAQNVATRSPGLAAMLQRSYAVIARGVSGVWYVTDDPGTPSGVPGDNRLHV
jgi:hypothetical protein